MEGCLYCRWLGRVGASAWEKRLLGGAGRGPRFRAMSPTIEEIRQLVSAPMSRRGVVHAGLFGSVARGDATSQSDADFLVEFEKGRTLLDLSGLRLDLVEVLVRDVDVATPGSLHPDMREGILGELVPLL